MFLFIIGYDMIQEEEDLTKKNGGGKERHFSYYAYAGMTGTRRWVHRSEVSMMFHAHHDWLLYRLWPVMTQSSFQDHHKDDFYVRFSGGCFIYSSHSVFPILLFWLLSSIFMMDYSRKAPTRPDLELIIFFEGLST
jgi:hypothetical protein